MGSNSPSTRAETQPIPAPAQPSARVLWLGDALADLQVSVDALREDATAVRIAAARLAYVAVGERLTELERDAGVEP